MLQEADSFPAWPRCDRICGLPRFVSIFLALRVTPVFMRPVGRNTSELETGLSQVIGLANLLAVVLYHQASANSSTLSDMRQPSGAVLHGRRRVQAWYSHSGSAKRQDGISTFSRRASTPLRRLTEFSEFYCVTEEHFPDLRRIKSDCLEQALDLANPGHELLPGKAVRPGRQAPVEPQRFGYQL